MSVIPRVPRDIEKVIVDDLRLAVEGQRVLITGGSGFVGSWLLELIYWGWRKHGVRVKDLILLSRRASQSVEALSSAEEFKRVIKAVDVDLARENCDEVVDAFRRAGVENIDAVIHAAADASSKMLAQRPVDLLLNAIKMMDLILNVAGRMEVKNFLLTSSGAAYGSGNGAPLREDDLVAPSTMSPKQVYGESKRCAEMMLACAGQSGGVGRALVARLFTFTGPYLPLDGHFAVSCFMRDALAGRDVEVRSPGVVRSYLHGFEMAAVLMALLARGKSCEIYNLGSDVPVDMLTLSQAVAVVSHRRVKVLEGAVGGGSFSGDYYLPCMKKTWGLCGYKTWLSLRECVEQTMAWHRERAEVKLG